MVESLEKLEEEMMREMEEIIERSIKCFATATGAMKKDKILEIKDIKNYKNIMQREYSGTDPPSEASKDA